MLPKLILWRKQSLRVFVDGAIISELWLLISVAAALYFLSKFSPQVKAFPILMCINTRLEYNTLVTIKLGMWAEGFA